MQSRLQGWIGLRVPRWITRHSRYMHNLPEKPRDNKSDWTNKKTNKYNLEREVGLRSEGPFEVGRLHKQMLERVGGGDNIRRQISNVGCITVLAGDVVRVRVGDRVRQAVHRVVWGESERGPGYKFEVFQSNINGERFGSWGEAVVLGSGIRLSIELMMNKYPVFLFHG